MISDSDNFYDFVYETFYGFSDVRAEDVGIIFSRDVQYPLIDLLQEPVMVIPMPKLVGKQYVYEGMVFDNSPEGRKDMWSLFLATLYHLSSHAAVASYAKYEKWRENKTADTCWKVIDFIEDISAERYLRHKDKAIWQNMSTIEARLLEVTKSNESHSSKNPRYSKRFQDQNESTKISLLRDEIAESIGKDGYEKKLLSIADFLYKNRELLERPLLPFQEHHEVLWSPKVGDNGIKLERSGAFEAQAQKLDSLWETHEQQRNKILKRYKKHLKGLNFDSIVIPAGNVQAYEKIKANTLPMLRRIRQQIRLIANLTDDPKIDQIGYIDMQMAIQAVASEGQTTEIFERDELRRGEEAWVILIDKSASMELRFDSLKEFAVCVSESANELTGKQDAWALYSFDNNFNIVKDFKEKFNQEIKARIGTITNGGLSLLPDAIELSARILTEDPRERKYIFVVTDGHPSGYDRIHEAFTKTIKKTEMHGITLVGIGVTKAISRKFRNSARGTDLKQLVTKFVTAYKVVAIDV